MTSGGSLAVRVPGSSANLGPGFDVLGLALSIHADVGVVDAGHRADPRPDLRQFLVEGRHPARVAYRAAGGRGEVWVRSAIPSGRGLGFSGAVRVGAVALGLAESNGVIGRELRPFIDENRREILNLAAQLEGHADNVAASLMGGATACVERGGEFTAATVPIAPTLISATHVVVWVPHEQTATAESRASLAESVSRSDAVFNLSRIVQLVLALGTGDTSMLAIAVEDRLHQDQRLMKVPSSRRALEVMHAAGAAACWLSGSGPTVACLVPQSLSMDLERALAADDLASVGRSMRLAVDLGGLQAAV